MTQKNIHKIVDKQEQDGEHSTIIAGKLVRLDVFKMGAKDWLNQSGSEVADGFVDVAGITIGVVVDELKSRLAGEELIDDMGLSQSDRLSFEEIEKFHTSVLDTFKVLATYLRILEIAKHQHDERNNE